MAAARGLSPTLVHGVNPADAKGADMNPTATKSVVAAFGAPSPD